MLNIRLNHGGIRKPVPMIFISFIKKYEENLVMWLNLVTFAPVNKKEKLVKRFRTLPKDFTFEEVESLFQGYGFELANKGATSGSRIKFFNAEDQNAYIMHKPHPSNIIKGYIMRDILNFLIKNNYIK
jgi:hypothetical protein